MDFDQLRRLASDDEAVSPVIGVILMVAITVILAAVIGTFVLGLGNQVTGSTAPTADFSFDYDSDNSDLKITHNGGDKIDNSTVSFSCDNGGCGSVSMSIGGDSEWTAGDSAELQDIQPDETARVVWTSEGGGSSQTLAEYTAPS